MKKYCNQIYAKIIILKNQIYAQVWKKLAFDNDKLQKENDKLKMALFESEKIEPRYIEWLRSYGYLSSLYRNCDCDQNMYRHSTQIYLIFIAVVYHKSNWQ